MHPGAGAIKVNDALLAIQTYLNQNVAGAEHATVGLVGGFIEISLGSNTTSTLGITDGTNNNASASDTTTLGLANGTYSPIHLDSALIRTGVETEKNAIVSEGVIGAPGGHVEEHIVRNLNTLPGDPSTSGIFTIFGQFFDHGLDFINKGGQGSKVIIPLSPDDPMYGQIGPDGQPVTSITISRATPDGYTVNDIHGRPVPTAAGSDPAEQKVVYTNHTSPFIDQSQSYGSDTQTTLMLREWVEDPNHPGQYIPGAELFDGHQTQAYNSQTFNDAAPGGLGVGTTTRTVPTLNELRAHLLATASRRSELG